LQDRTQPPCHESADRCDQRVALLHRRSQTAVAGRPDFEAQSHVQPGRPRLRSPRMPRAMTPGRETQHCDSITPQQNRPADARHPPLAVWVPVFMSQTAAFRYPSPRPCSIRPWMSRRHARYGDNNNDYQSRRYCVIRHRTVCHLASREPRRPSPLTSRSRGQHGISMLRAGCCERSTSQSCRATLSAASGNQTVAAISPRPTQRIGSPPRHYADRWYSVMLPSGRSTV